MPKRKIVRNNQTKINDADNSDLNAWFDKHPSDFWFDLSTNKDSTTGKERKFLYDLGCLRNRGKTPSQAQLAWAKSVCNRFATEEKIPKYNDKSGGIDIDMADTETRHLTARMAWHTDSWNGRICSDPEKNEYCVGEYSLLSRRIRQRRKLDKEIGCKAERADVKKLDGYLPPCFWSINAFSDHELKVAHEHPMYLKNTPSIKELLPPFSIFTWPFRLSFHRKRSVIDREGIYPKNLEPRIDRFFTKIKNNQSIVFLYANYDNPVSGDEQKYLIIGCALLKDKGEKHFYDIPDDILKELRSNRKRKNFPTISWDYRIQLDCQTIVNIPYQEYLKDAEENDNFDLLEEIKVTVDEPGLIQCFKYVAMDIDDDQAIYLLTKIRRSLLIIKEHSRFPESYDVDKNVERIESLLKRTWQKRGIFPGFPILARVILDRLKDSKLPAICNLIDDLKSEFSDDYYDQLREIVDCKKFLNGFQKYEDEIDELQQCLKSLEVSVNDFLTLSMLNLMPYQFQRILEGHIGEKKTSISEICKNPYLLYEEYTYDEGKNDENPHTGERIDGLIDLTKIDVAFFSDTRYLKKFAKIQKLSPSDPQRIRALVISYLNSLKNIGNCFDVAPVIEKALSEYPLFYKTTYLLSSNILSCPSVVMKEHLDEKIVTITDEGNKYYYLKEVYNAEQFISQTIKTLLDMTNLAQIETTDHSKSLINLKERLGERFEADAFLSEREALYRNIFKKRLYILSGSPGTGKSYELLSVVDNLRGLGQKCLILAPTGKAVLRLKLNEEGFEDIDAQTIDRFLWDNKSKADQTISVENIIVDEMSMVDLMKLDELLRKLDLESPSFKRIVLVGDENQLPPIGFGKPYIDIVSYVTQNNYADNYVCLDVNCRQQLDENIIKFSKVYSGHAKHHEPLLKKALQGGQISEGLYISFWKNREELRSKIQERFLAVFDADKQVMDLNLLLNKIFNLYDNGFVNNTDFKFYEYLKHDAFQIITPYRAAYYGSLGLNNYIHSTFRPDEEFIGKKIPFKHSDKIIQTRNLYRNRELLLSNGSMGIVTNRKKGFYFPEVMNPLSLDSLNDEELELAYAITVHKAQGSGFDHVFYVLPAKKGLLSRELNYTALTRSKQGISIFVYGEQNQDIKESLFEQIRNNSSVELRKTSLLGQPYWEFTLCPERGINVRSRIEYIIYKKLQQCKDQLGDFAFQYEEPYRPKKRDFEIKPDFTIRLSSGKVIYWEHLGKLGNRSYERDWTERRKIYEEDGLMANLITTDETRGIADEKVTDVILAVLADSLETEMETNRYSLHHYYLS